MLLFIAEQKRFLAKEFVPIGETSGVGSDENDCESEGYVTPNRLKCTFCVESKKFWRTRLVVAA